MTNRQLTLEEIEASWLGTGNKIPIGEMIAWLIKRVESLTIELDVARTELSLSKQAFLNLQVRTNCACHEGDNFVPGSVCQDCFSAVMEKKK